MPVFCVGTSELLERWKGFVHTHHYGRFTNLYESFLGRNPRRSCDAFGDMTMDLNMRSEAPISVDASWEELRDWVAPYLEAEKEAAKRK